MTEGVEAIVQAAGAGTRLGHGPKAFLALGDSTLVERAVAATLGVAERVIVAVRPEDLPRAHAAFDRPGIVVIEGGPTRTETTERLLRETQATWLILHDVVHPFVTSALVQAVVDAAMRDGAACPGLPVTEYAYARDVIEPVARPGELFLAQKPFACRRADLQRGMDWLATQPPEVRDRHGGFELLTRVGIRPTFIPGDPMNMKLTYAADLELARLLASVGHEVRPAT